MNKYRVAFFGTPKIAQSILEALTKMNEVEIVLVVSQPDRKIGRKKVLTPTPVKQFCLENNLTCLQPEKVGEIFETLQNANLDFIITCAYGQFVPSKILGLPKYEPLNIHGSLLPKYRGGAPIQYAILNGDQETGVSLMRMVKEMDAGPVFSTRTVKISPEETTGSLFLKIAKLGQQIITEDLVKVAERQLSPVEQNNQEATFAPNITTAQEKIDWNKTNKQIDQLVRSLTPSPTAHTFINQERYKIGKVKLVEDQTETNKIPGEIIKIDHEGIIVQTGKGLLKILELQRPGKTMQPVNNYGQNQNLKDIKIGTKFE